MRSSGAWTPRGQEVKATRSHIAEVRARQASSTQEKCVYKEHCSEFTPYHFLKPVDNVVGDARHLIQLTRMNGPVLVGLTRKALAERLNDGSFEIEGTILRTFPFRKRSDNFTIGNLPFYVEDAVIIKALRPYGRVTSIAPKQLKAGDYGYTDGRREAYILFHDGIKIEKLTTRLDIKTKGDTLLAFLTFGIRDFVGPAALLTHQTRCALEDAASLSSFCRHLVDENLRGTFGVGTIEEAVVLRRTRIQLLCVTTRTGHRMLERLAALSITQLARRRITHLDLPNTISWSSLRRCVFSGNDADVAVKLHALSHPAHPASAQQSCVACGSSDLTLANLYWSCRCDRPLIWKPFTIIGRPPYLQG
ncbi:hypothetical protein LAZ67_4003442 [Cordylochernes scorpioides]|uniref:DNA-directed RNA polymerase n=1 Tax=Cordylochernes scorpioides TaxID=51811 RepID=A0ABY6KED9_9ARAC|nr:hypothetical protein LAZ67_4003442 [Cordylochernes scorpioides]